MVSNFGAAPNAHVQQAPELASCLSSSALLKAANGAGFSARAGVCVDGVDHRGSVGCARAAGA